MYQIIDGTTVISVNDWCAAGLTENQFKKDSSNGYLSICRRGIRGNTLIDVKSIKRPERLAIIEQAFGRVEREAKMSIFKVEIDTDARAYFVDYRKPDGSPLEDD